MWIFDEILEKYYEVVEFHSLLDSNDNIVTIVICIDNEGNFIKYNNLDHLKIIKNPNEKHKICS